jgi:serine/threonine protein kinase
MADSSRRLSRMSRMSKIHRPLGVDSMTGGSFDAAHRDLLWYRVSKGMAIGLAISLIYGVVGYFYFRSDALIQTPLSKIIPRLFWGHGLSFGLALTMLMIMREKACAMRLELITFLVFAFNIVLGLGGHVACRPGDMNYLGLSIMLFVPAAFVPWKLRSQLGLGLVGLTSYLGPQLFNVYKWEAAREFWAGRSGQDGFGPTLFINSLGIVILTLVSMAISRTLYNFSKTSHQVQRLGSYEVLEEIGRGGMGRVLKARHHMICRPAAVKLLEAPVGEAGLAMSRFEREVHLSAHLNHPNTIQIYDFGRTADNRFFYAMEYLSGLDLERMVERFGPLPASRIVFILRQVVGSLNEAHNKGIVHRDIKPSNIFLTSRGGLCDFVKVLDFGLAKQVSTAGAHASVTKTGMVFGTPRYIAPEALYGTDGIDARSDLYNLGGVAYWLLTGRPPFDTDSSVDLIIDHVKNPPPAPSTVSETPIPSELEALVMRLLAKKPDERYQSAAELDAALVALPTPEPWDWESAKDWWNLHGLIEDEACFPLHSSESEATRQMEGIIAKPLEA